MMRFGDTFIAPEHIFAVEFRCDTKTHADPQKQVVERAVIVGFTGVQLSLTGAACDEFCEWWEQHYEEYPVEYQLIEDDDRDKD